jgi:hypothetical protein
VEWLLGAYLCLSPPQFLMVNPQQFELKTGARCYRDIIACTYLYAQRNGGSRPRLAFTAAQSDYLFVANNFHRLIAAISGGCAR